MKRSFKSGILLSSIPWVFWLCCMEVSAQPKEIPPALEPWKNWVLWGEQHPQCPSPYNDGRQRICIWPSQLSLDVNQSGGSWKIRVQAFETTWLPLPGGGQTWPQQVLVDGEQIPVVQRQGVPSLPLAEGTHEVSGEFQWNEMPQRLAIPKSFGILSLTIYDKRVARPIWDAAGDVWLKRDRLASKEKDSLALKVYRVIEDGIPLWLRTQIDVTATGKSREEELGWILPQGWQLSLVESPIPVAVDELGQIKTQVRAGKWRIELHAFRTVDFETFQYAPQAQPLVASELIGFRARPELRIAELEGGQVVDVTQTTFPDAWRRLPVLEWNTRNPLQLVEKMRGMGVQRPDGLTIQRHFWLDEDGQSLTYRDQVQGQLQQVWRLDTAAGQVLGAVRTGGQRQLITTNPETDAQGIEIRDRNLQLEAIGRIEDSKQLSATGWQSDASTLSASFSLPPGWRMFALLGADRVEGDWLTAWSLLDLFLLLLFSIGVLRLWGIGAGVIALLAFGLSYHEPNAPRYTWLFLLIPLALLRVTPAGKARNRLAKWKYFALFLLLLNIVPFAARQIQGAIYPQLEIAGQTYGTRSMFWQSSTSNRSAHSPRRNDAVVLSNSLSGTKSMPAPTNQAQSVDSRVQESRSTDTRNLTFDPKMRVQTGPAEPEWGHRKPVACAWKGPVSSDQQIRPIFISCQVHRLLTVVRLALLALLALVLLRGRGIGSPLPGRGLQVVVYLLLSFSTRCAQGQVAGDQFAGGQFAGGQMPDAQILATLRERLLQPADSFPHAADIASVRLKLEGERVVMQAQIHAPLEVAVPLPGRLPGWSPLTVTLDRQSAAVVRRRKDGYLWVVIPPGVHEVEIEGWLPKTVEWEWTFLLAPHRVEIDAPGWNVTGVRPNGAPEDQVLFTRQEQSKAGAATYDQKNFAPIVVVERRLEIGLLWKIHNKVSRISSLGKAISQRIPLLPGEKVLTSNLVVEQGFMEVNLGASESHFQWESELAPRGTIELVAAPTDAWVERWQLVSSPVWNVAIAGVSPIYRASDTDLIPHWHPWPGETVTLTLDRPKAVQGETLTVQRVTHTTSLGARQRATRLKLDIESSMGNDFVIDFDPTATVSSLNVAGETLPARREGSKLMIPVRTGKQSVEVAWTSPEKIASQVSVSGVTLPVQGANITTTMIVPESRWILWASGPVRGPAVRFWSILVFSLLVAVVLGSLKISPLSRVEWVLLLIGLTQVHLVAAMCVVGWLFLIPWRNTQETRTLGRWRFNFQQIGLLFITLVMLIVVVAVVGEGLLGNPKMFILGNGSSRTNLNWFQPRAGLGLPEPGIVSISSWYYRFAMLAWALWIAMALLRWLQLGWTAFRSGGGWKSKVKTDLERASDP